MGIKHNTIAHIYNFKQKGHETVRDCANRLRQYIARCPTHEIPSHEALSVAFLERAVEQDPPRQLVWHEALALNECVIDAIDLDDNCLIFGNISPRSAGSDHTYNAANKAGESGVKSTQPPNTESIAEEVFKQMNIAMRQP